MMAMPFLLNPRAVLIDEPNENAASIIERGGEDVMMEHPRSPATGTSSSFIAKYKGIYGQSSHMGRAPRFSIVCGTISRFTVSILIFPIALLISSSSAMPYGMCPVSFPNTLFETCFSITGSVSSTTSTLECFLIKRSIRSIGKGFTIVRERWEILSGIMESTSDDGKPDEIIPISPFFSFILYMFNIEVSAYLHICGKDSTWNRWCFPSIVRCHIFLSIGFDWICSLFRTKSPLLFNSLLVSLIITGVLTFSDNTKASFTQI